ncbi:hypothetical protein NF212_22745 [Parasalinivibrio latis]|uniref:hypothetical protein n=1 Tax=Parasalinivibrio latis TaxID=2952610 RepID=UPI0030E144A0
MITPLKSAYFGELYGLAFFDHFIRFYPDSSKQEAFHVLWKVEALTARLLREGVASIGESVPDHDRAMEEKGIADAVKWINLPWETLIDTMVAWVEPYQKRYQADTDVATKHLALYTLVSDHENAIFDFLLAEQSGQKDSLGILKTFLGHYQSGLDQNSPN